MSSFKADFRETAKVLSKFQAQARKAIYSQAGYIRTVARNSMKRIKKPSQPGQPPHAQTGLLKDFLFFAWDASTASMVIGPAAFKPSPEVPALLEEGGNEVAHVRIGKRWQRKTITIAPRPYMAPALELSQDKLPEFWAKSVA